MLINGQESEIVRLPVPGFFAIGHYGKNFATSKTYFFSDVRIFATDHKFYCESQGLMLLRLDSLEEAEYFLSVIRSVEFGVQDWTGAYLDGGKWIWRESNDRINYELLWATGFPEIGPSDCLVIDIYGFKNTPCTSLNFFVCQRVGG